MSIQTTLQSAFEGANFHVFSVNEEGVNWHVVARNEHNHSDRYVFEVDDTGVFWLTMADNYVRLGETVEDLTEHLSEINTEGLLCFLECNGHLSEGDTKALTYIRGLIRESILLEMNLECMECGKKFAKKNPTVNTKCPKCGSYDIDLALREASLRKIDTGAIGKLDPQVAKQLKATIQAIKKVDWYYPMSDDHRAYSKGRAYETQVKKMVDQLPSDIAAAVRKKYQPKSEPGVGIASI